MATTHDEELEVEILNDGAGTLMALNSSEIDMQISTAKKYPRSVREFRREAGEMATLDEEIAGECMYALKRGGKVIEGPSARFAEIAVSAWGNSRAGARVISEDDRFVTAQGAFYDLQRNVAVTYEVRRRITDKFGKKYNDDMIGVTANAACSIALRNAILKGIPKAFWKQVYDEARKTAIGDAKTLGSKRAAMVGYFAKLGASEAEICEFLEVKGVEDITLDHLALLKGIATAIKDGETTIEHAFAKDAKPKPGSRVSKSKLNEEIKNATANEPGGALPDDHHEAAKDAPVTDDDSQDGPAKDGLSESDQKTLAAFLKRAPKMDADTYAFEFDGLPEHLKPLAREAAAK